MGNAVTTARGDLKKAAAHLAIGIGCGAALVGWFAIAGITPFTSMRLLILAAMAAIYGVGRGTWLLLDARRRLALAERMRTPPAVRVVRGGEPR